MDASTVARVRLLALTLGVTAVAAAVGGVLWPEAEGGGDTYSYADIAHNDQLHLFAFLVPGALLVEARA